MRTRPCLMPLGFVLAALSGAEILSATNITVTGNFTADNSVYMTTLSLATMEQVTAFTTSYAGGTNLDTTTTPAGGFVPEITIFSGTSGNVVASSPNGACGGMGAADPATGLCNDAFLRATLGPGSYSLFLTEFPNTVDPGNTSTPTFLFSGSATATGDACGITGGMFYEADLAPCVQRTSAYALNISTAAAGSVVPEPAMVWIAGLALVIAGIRRRRKTGRS